MFTLSITPEILRGKLLFIRFPRVFTECYKLPDILYSIPVVDHVLHSVNYLVGDSHRTVSPLSINLLLP